MFWYKQNGAMWIIVAKIFVGLEQGFCKDFVECLMKDGNPKVASKYTYFYLQKSHKWKKKKSQVLMKN